MEKEVHPFWRAFNSSRCKTAMLIVTAIITLGFTITEILQIPNDDFQLVMMAIVGFWSGRSTKIKDKS